MIGRDRLTSWRSNGTKNRKLTTRCRGQSPNLRRAFLSTEGALMLKPRAQPWESANFRIQAPKGRNDQPSAPWRPFGACFRWPHFPGLSPWAVSSAHLRCSRKKGASSKAPMARGWFAMAPRGRSASEAAIIRDSAAACVPIPCGPASVHRRTTRTARSGGAAPSLLP